MLQGCGIDQLLALGAQLLEAFLGRKLGDRDVPFDRFALSLALFKCVCQRLDSLLECGFLVLETRHLLRLDLAIESERRKGGALARKVGSLGFPVALYSRKIS